MSTETVQFELTPLEGVGARLMQFGGFDKAAEVPVNRCPPARGRPASANSLFVEDTSFTIVRMPSVATAMPDAVQSNWSRLFRANLSEGLYASLLRLARCADGWRGKGSRGLT